MVHRVLTELRRLRGFGGGDAGWRALRSGALGEAAEAGPLGVGIRATVLVAIIATRSIFPDQVFVSDFGFPLEFARPRLCSGDHNGQFEFEFARSGLCSGGHLLRWNDWGPGLQSTRNVLHHRHSPSALGLAQEAHTMTRAPDNNVIEMPWTWERYMRLTARGYYSRVVETELTIASLRAAGDVEGAELTAAHARRPRNVIHFR
jgi:hypothetical protein